MKNVRLILLFIYFGNILQAQSSDVEPSTSNDQQIGINVTNFVLTFFSFNEPNNSTPLIYVLYKKNKDGKRKRYGFGGRVNWNKNSNNDRFFSSRLNFNFGREFERNIGKRWKTYVGYETFLGGTYNQIVEERFNGDKDKSYTRTANIGWKALVGLEFFINERLSLLTESSYSISFNYQLNRNPNFNQSRRESYSAGTFYIPPTSMILSYHF